MKKKITNIVFPDKDIRYSIRKRNSTIIFYTSIVSIFSRIFSIISFNRQVIDSAEGTLWKNYIVKLHTFFLGVWIVIALLTLFCKFIKKDLKYFWITEYLAFMAILGL